MAQTNGISISIVKDTQKEWSTYSENSKLTNGLSLVKESKPKPNKNCKKTNNNQNRIPNRNEL